VHVKSKAGHLCRAVLLLAGTGLLANGIVRPENGSIQPPTRLSVRALAWEWLGGLRPVGANLAWLQLQGAWQQRNPAEVMAWIRIAIELEPQSLYFWANGARMIANDLPAWLSAAGQASAEIRQRQADLALALLDDARAWHDQNPQYWIERATIELNGVRDYVAAADSFRRAAQCPGAPYFAARLHAELLVRQGRLDAAHAWLVGLHPTLPPRDPRAQSDLVLERIRALERRLELPPEQCYVLHNQF